jgi:organic hydroperoxide reductase OsmC/OhrA
MSNHTAAIRWQNTGPDFLKRRYSREHTIHFDGGAIVPGSPSPHIVPAPWSNAAAVDPEEAFVASVASCHMLWFLHVAVDGGFEAASYED